MRPRDRITREVIRNAFAHAAASLIKVEIRYDPDQLRNAGA